MPASVSSKIPSISNSHTSLPSFRDQMLDLSGTMSPISQPYWVANGLPTIAPPRLASQAALCSSESLISGFSARYSSATTGYWANSGLSW